MQYAALLSHERTENSLLALWLVEADWETFIIIDANIVCVCDGIQMGYVHVFALWVSVSWLHAFGTWVIVNTPLFFFQINK